MIQGGLEVNYQNQNDEEAEFERDELERQNEVRQYWQFMLLIRYCSFYFKH